MFIDVKVGHKGRAPIGFEGKNIGTADGRY